MQRTGMSTHWFRNNTVLVPAIVFVASVSMFRGSAFAQPQPRNAQAVTGQALGPFVFNGDVRDLQKADPNLNRQQDTLRPGRPAGIVPGGPQGAGRDPLLPAKASQIAAPQVVSAPISSFPGTPGGNPPDTNGVAGPNHYIQTINVVFAIWDKPGNQLAAPIDFRTFFASGTPTGTSCDSGAVSDPVVLYDGLSDRFVLTILAGTQFRPTLIGPFYECIAVSKTNDPVSGGWYKYALQTDATSLSDFPKLGVWPDAYYMSANMFPTAGSAFVRVWAIDRNSIVAGGALHEQHFDVPTAYFSLLPENLLGPAPPAGEPNVFAAVNFNNDNKVFLWNFHVDWAVPANSTFGDASHNPTHTVTVAAYNHLTLNIPQPGTSVVSLDALGDRLNYPAQYRIVGANKSLWLDHPVDTGGNLSGIRWYEIRDPSGSPTLAQQGTLGGGDAVHRWMGAIGADQFGNMGIGYNVSNATAVYPGIRYAGRSPGDPAGTLEPEVTLIAGASNIINCTPDASKGETTCVGRWGDYSGMSVDPAPACRFWFTGEYVTGGSNSTQIGSFTLSGCPSPPVISKGFAAPTVPLNQNTLLNFTIANPNASIALTGVGFTDTLPLGLAMASPGVFAACGGTATVTVNSVSLTGATIAGGANCVLSLPVTGTIPGTQNNTTSIVNSANGGPGNTASASITVVAPPTIQKAFGAISIPLNSGITSLTFTIGNPNTTVALTGVAFTDNLPPGLIVATPNGLGGSCTGVITAAAGSSTISLTGGTIAVLSSCTLVVDVTGTSAGTKNNTTSHITSLNGGTGLTASATLIVLAPPTISKSFADSQIELFFGSTALRFTVANPPVNPLPLNGISFTDTLPSGLIVLAPDNGLTGSCGGGVITAVPGSNTISLAFATLGVNASCTFSVLVNGAAIGVQNNITSPITSTNGGTGLSASATISVVSTQFLWFFTESGGGHP